MNPSKKMLRPYEAKPLNIAPGHGLLCAESVKYIVGAEVKIITRRRVLILRIYPVDWVKAGNRLARWCVFQTMQDFVTLERAADGSTCWRRSMTWKLRDKYPVETDSAFYSRRDRQAAARFLHQEERIWQSLADVQERIRENQHRKVQARQEQVLIDKFAALPRLPVGLERWIRNEIMPSYFFYTYRQAKRMQGFCTHCGSTVEMERPKAGLCRRCPRCGHTVLCKPRGRRGRIWDRATCQVVQRLGNGQLVIRIVKAFNDFGSQETAVWHMTEAARVFVTEHSGSCSMEWFYDSFDRGVRTTWKKGLRPTMFPYQESFMAETIAWLYPGNLPRVFAGTLWGRCPVQKFAADLGEPFDLADFMNGYLRHPCVEQIIKAGFPNMAASVVYERSRGLVNETQSRLHRMLRVEKCDLAFLREHNAENKLLGLCQKYQALDHEKRHQLMEWQIENATFCNMSGFLAYTTIHKLTRYLEQQVTEFSEHCFYRDQNPMERLVGLYEDYLRMCVQQRYDLKNRFVLFPKNVREAHDRLAEQIRLEADRQQRLAFEAVCREMQNKLNYTRSGMVILCPQRPEDIVAEGQALHHCVGSYVSRVAEQKTLILFLRRQEEPETPFYTIEVKGACVVQVRGMKNADPTPEVQTFMRCWERDVLLPAQTNAA